MVSPSSPDAAPGIAIVTVSYGSGAVLEPFLASVASASSSPVTTVVADNRAGEGDNVQSLTVAAGAGYVPMPGNPGYGAAVNSAVRSLGADVEWILVSNPDVVLAPGCIDTLLATALTDERIASVGPCVLGSEGEVYPSARSVPSLRTGVGHALFVNLWTENPWTRAYRRDAESTAVRRDAGWLSGACLLVRRSAFDELGGFDDGYFMYFEDVDLGYRLGKAGYRNVYEPAATVTHTGAHSTTSDSERMVRTHHESARRFLSKKYAGVLLWPIRASLRLGLWARSTLIVRKLRR
jgi:N-acetylglucosaminyl-diphospho-decaprenol L-rhamnosyltransferase